MLMWLLLAALPMQSWAVATMLNCGPSHHRMTLHPADATAEAHHGRSSHEEHDQAEHDHGPLHHDVATNDGNTHQPQPDNNADPLSMGTFKCSACATCCLGMALPSPVLAFEAKASSDTVELGVPQGHVVFLTAGLERPPRTFLA